MAEPEATESVTPQPQEMGQIQAGGADVPVHVNLIGPGEVVRVRARRRVKVDLGPLDTREQRAEAAKRVAIAVGLGLLPATRAEAILKAIRMIKAETAPLPLHEPAQPRKGVTQPINITVPGVTSRG